MRYSLGLIFLIFTQESAVACIWQNNTDPFWPSTNIEVCFLPPDAEDLQNIDAFNAAKEIMIQTYRDFDRQSDFSFNGFSECNDLNATNRSPKIRIDLTTAQINGEAESIGPASSTQTKNLTISYVVAESKESTSLQPRHPTNIQFLVFHETMHLLGFHHECVRTDTKRINSYNENGALILGNFDPESVTYVTDETNNNMSLNIPVRPTTPRLSVEDRRCLRILADRSINSRASNLQPPTTVDQTTPTSTDERQTGAQ